MSQQVHSSSTSVAALSIWYLDADGERLTLKLIGLSGTAGSDPIDHVAFGSGTLAFRRPDPRGSAWYRAATNRGVLKGRIAITASSTAAPPFDSTLWSGHVTGWSETELDTNLYPRAFDLVIDGDRLAMLRIDAVTPANGGPMHLSGRLKVYASMSRGAVDEDEEEDLEVTAWDGASLRFVSHKTAVPRVYEGTVDGRTITGTSSAADASTVSAWQGVRADVLGFGFARRTGEAGDAWRQATRDRLTLLMMNEDPVPSSTAITFLARRSPFSGTSFAADRDDDASAWPQDYTLTEIQLDSTLRDPHGGPDLVRRNHGVIAIPTSPVPEAGYPAVVAVNGHEGSAAQMMNPESQIFWYGDAFARRGYVVLALDISHRDYGSRSSLYTDELDGDDPANGNHAHPAIAGAGFDSDWEEDGERVFDVMRAADVLRATEGVDASRILIVGLSLGGEVAAYSAALDPRFAQAIVAGFSPDLGVVAHHQNHACWVWQHADAREYIDASDLFALILPRPLVVETGELDSTFSSFRAPFAADKQVMRRASAAGAPTHFMHGGTHELHIGDVPAASARGISVPQAMRPAQRYSEDWQEDPTTKLLPETVFDLLGSARPG